MDTRKTKRSDQKSESQASKNKPYRIVWEGSSGSLPTEKVPSTYRAKKEEELRRRGKREGKTRYISLPDEHGNDDRRGPSFHIYNIDESSDDEFYAEMCKIPMNADQIRVKSKVIKKYKGFEEGLFREGKRLAKTVKISSTGKCIRRIYDLDEASSDEKQPAVKNKNKIEKKSKKRKAAEIDEGVSTNNPSSMSNRLKYQSSQTGIYHKKRKIIVDEAKTPQADQKHISASENHELDDITKYGTIGWQGYVPPSKSAISNIKTKLHDFEEPLSMPNYTNKRKAETAVEYKHDTVVIHFPEVDESTEYVVHGSSLTSQKASMNPDSTDSDTMDSDPDRFLNRNNLQSDENRDMFYTVNELPPNFITPTFSVDFKTGEVIIKDDNNAHLSKSNKSGELPYANSKFTTFSANQPIRTPNKPNNNHEPEIKNYYKFC